PVQTGRHHPGAGVVARPGARRRGGPGTRQGGRSGHRPVRPGRQGYQHRGPASGRGAVMMKTLLIAAAMAAFSPSLTLAQNTAAPAPQAPVQTAPTVPPGPAATGMPVLPPATEAADCGGLLRSPAFCVTAQLDQI